jgi:hypothetical protein
VNTELAVCPSCAVTVSYFQASELLRTDAERVRCDHGVGCSCWKVRPQPGAWTAKAALKAMLSSKRIYSSGFSSRFSVRGDESYQIMRYKKKSRSFREAFGVLGAPKLLTMLTCVAWTTWLVVVALAPNETANWLMGTGDYDNGQFWMIIDSDPSMATAGAVGLALVDACYLYVVVKTLRWRERIDEVASFHHLQAITRHSQDAVASSRRSRWERVRSIYHHGRRVYKDLTGFFMGRIASTG